MTLESRELLEDCLDVLKAIRTASASRKLLKKWGMSLIPGRNAKDSLAGYMAKKIEDHFAQVDRQ